MDTPTQRQQRAPRRTIKSDEAYASIVNAARDLRIRTFLSPSQQRRAREAAAVLEKPQSSRSRQEYRVFLYDVHSKCGPDGVLLCAVKLGQHKATTMRKNDRASLIETLEKNKNDSSISCSIIRSLALEHGIPTTIEDIDTITYNEQAIIQQETQTPNSELSETLEDTNTVSSSSQSPRTVYDDLYGSLADTPRHGTALEMNEYASLDGIARVFDPYISSTIRRVTIQMRQTTIIKAAVTIVFPNRGDGVDCLLSLDVEDWAVEYLVMVLFNAKTEWVKQTRRIILGEGIKMTIPEPDLTMTGVRHEALLAVFGTGIYRAIHDSPMRRREMQEGKQETDCVSMILTQIGAIINLSLGLNEGLRIRSRLYT